MEKEYITIEVTEEMREDRKKCGEDSDCNECSCHLGTDACIWHLSD